MFYIDSIYTRKDLIHNAKSTIDTGPAVSQRSQQMSASQIQPGVRLNTLVEPHGQGVVVHRDLCPLFVSPGYAQVHGFDSVNDILGLASLESLYAGQSKPQLLGLEKARRDGHPPPEIFEYDGRARDGRVIPLLCSASLVEWDGAPAIQQTVTDLSDIRTSRRSLETRLQKLDHQVRLRTEELGHLRDLMFADTSMRERFENANGHSEQRLRAVADHVPADITLKDLDGRYILVKP